MNAAKNVWQRASKEPLQVRDMTTGEMVQPEPGVRYFIRQLSRMGAQSLMSCEGHERTNWRWWLTFDAPFETAVKIEAAGVFAVHLFSNVSFGGRRTASHWALELDHIHSSRVDRNTVLVRAADAWEKAFGPLYEGRRK